MTRWLRIIASWIDVKYPMRTLLWGVLLVATVIKMQEEQIALACLLFLISLGVGLELTVLRCRDDIIRKLDSMIYERDEG